jgi:foldase protein PrsA
MIYLFAALAIAKQMPNTSTITPAPVPSTTAVQTPLKLTVPLAPEPNKVVITVNGHQITAKEIFGYLWDWDAAQVGQALTVIELIRQEAVKQGVNVTQAEVEQQVTTEIQQLMARVPRGTSQDDALKMSRVTISRIELGSRAQLLLKKISDKSFNPNDFVRVQTLIIRAKTQDKTQEKAIADANMAKANEAYAALVKGDPWEKVFAAYATEAATQPNNGELGWVKAELDASKIGGFTKPVQTPNGIQIFKLENRGQNAVAGELDVAKARYQSTAQKEIVERLQKEAKITTSY